MPPFNLYSDYIVYAVKGNKTDTMPRKKTLPQIDNGRSKPTGDKIVKRFNYYDADGKRRGKTLTAYSEVEMAQKILQWNNSMAAKKNRSMTVLDAVKGYIDAKRSVLSPNTVRMYDSMTQHITIDKDIHDLTKADVQAWISSLVDKDMTPKTVRNINGLLQAALLMYTDRPIPVQLPQPRPPKTNCPSDEDVKKLIDAIKKKDDKCLLISVYLACFGPLREGEICALENTDIKGNTITVNKALALSPEKEWVVKAPKTVSSNRTIEMPEFVIAEMKGIKGRIVPLTPMALYNRYRKLCKKIGLDITFHSLRHYGCSKLHALGMSDLYVMQRGGWSSDYTMKKVYRNIIDEEQKRQTRSALDQFESMVSEVKSEVKIAENKL